MVIHQLDEQSIFDVARKISSADAREAYLQQVCGDEPRIKRRVSALLQDHVENASFLEAPPPGLVPELTLDQAHDRVGTLIGPYKLLEQIGEGGMGLVYMAEQQQPVRRLVALKLVKPGMDSKQVIARFEAERQALAMMDHSNIAKVHDAGTTETGRPYFVMELVRGIPINEFCDQQKLTVRQRLELFIQVCQAVQHAHQKGIIHRDIKPTNVLVTKADTVPLPKVIDFGIAKALGPSLTDHTLHTGFAQLVGTPMYMSPEQTELNHFGVDTRSDVYSLGVLLYELLTGTTPFDKETLSKAGLDEMRRIIREDEPETVSARIAKTRRVASAYQSSPASLAPSPQPLAPRMSELDWIVMKALEKDRSRRYESASALAADIQRYLTDEPVLACPPTTMYRFQKFARKHKPALATAAAIALCLILGTTVSAWQAARATTAEAQANANEQKAVTNEAQAKAAAAAEAQQRQRAEVNEQKANTQRDEAQRQRDEIKGLYDQLASKEQQLQRTLYGSNMSLAKHAWDVDNLARVNDLLAQHRPQPGQNDLRGWEWHYLHRLCHTELLTLKGYSAGGPAPHSVAFSPDGKRLAGPTQGGKVKVWNAESGLELLTISRAGAKGVAFSPDGKRLATGGGTWDDATNTFVAGEVKVWDALSGKEILTCKGHTRQVVSVAYSPDGKRLASGSIDWTFAQTPAELKVWDAETGQELLSLHGLTIDVYGVAFSPDGTRVAGASYNGNAVKVWDAKNGQELHSLRGGRASVAFSPDGSRLASGAKVWSAETGAELITLEHGGFSVAFSPDGLRLACSAKGIFLRDSQSGAEVHAYKGHTKTVNCVVFSPDGKRLASGSSDGTIKLWDAGADQEAFTFSGHTRQVRGVTFSPDGKRVAFGTHPAWDYAKQAYAGLPEVKVADAQTGRELVSCKGLTQELWCVAYSPDGHCVASGSSDKAVKVWDAKTGRELVTFTGHSAPVVSVAFSPDSTRVASCSSDPRGNSPTARPGEPGEVKVWDAKTGDELLNLKGHSRFVNCVTFSPDGKQLATLSRDQTVKLWDAQTGHELRTLKALTGVRGSLAFSPDGKRLASNNHRPANPEELAEVKVWDIRTGEELLTLKGHNGGVTSLIYSPDGKRLITGAGFPGGTGFGGGLKVWDALSGQELFALDGHSGFTNDLAISPDGHYLAGSGRDGTIKIWDATPLPETP